MPPAWRYPAPPVAKTRLATEAFATRAVRVTHGDAGSSERPIRAAFPLGAFADIATDFEPDPSRRVREVIDGLIGGDPDRRVVVGVDDAHLLDEVSAFAAHQRVSQRLGTVILTIRSGEQRSDAIIAIWKDGHLEHLDLQPLSHCTLDF